MYFPRQNKNLYVMGYLAWRVMTGLNREITYMMQVPGHGRCLVDAGFAHLQRKNRYYLSQFQQYTDQTLFLFPISVFSRYCYNSAAA